MNTTLLNVTRLNVTELNVTRLNSVGPAGMGKKGGIPSAIRRSMVLWYDIARQGCTNESMAENPILKDLSGNGHDATCYNFAWTEESGISSVNYPNALVADGVDDYAYVEGMPILTDYTVIAKRTIFEGSAGAIAAKNAEIGLGINVEFIFEGGTKFISNTYSFGTANNVSITNEDISWQTKSSYNGTKIDYGKINGGTILDIFGYRYATAALYSLLLFDRTLSQEEIEWVKENLIEGKTITM